MQLAKLVLYNHEGTQRVITFTLGAFNIITGTSATGKSAVLEIIEFCFGRKNVSLPSGPITSTVAWYGAIFRYGETDVFVARPAPTGKSTSQAMLKVGHDLAIPAFDTLKVDADAETVIAHLGALIGIGNNESVLEPTATRRPLEANMKHSLFYCFQRQSEIANQHQLFHRANEAYMEQTIKDTFPYFLGAVDKDAIAHRHQLAERKRRLRHLDRTLEAVKSADRDAHTHMASLAAEAAQVGLLSQIPDPISIESLQQVASTILPENNPPPTTNQYQILMNAQREDREALRDIEEKIAVLRSDALERQAFGEEISEQQSRLSIIGIVDETEEGAEERCPVCDQHLPVPDPTVQDVQATITQLGERLEAVKSLTPREEQIIGKLQDTAREYRERLRENTESLATLRALDENTRSYHELLQSQAFVQGQIAQFFKFHQEMENSQQTELEQKIARLSEEIERLNNQLSAEEQQERVTSCLNLISEDMTEWARRLNLEHSEGRVRINLTKLTVVVDTPSDTIPLNRMGSASNWVGYHVITHLALHKWFIEHRRPVPRILMLDQPTQAFYPPDAKDGTKTQPSNEDLSDEDRQAVHSIFQLINDVTHQLDGKLQVIVTDHAHLNDEWFQQSLIENWREGEALIPPTWLTN